MNAFWKSVSEKVAVGVLIAIILGVILAIPVKQGLVYLVERFGPQGKVPVGTILAWNGKGQLQDGWAICNGIDVTPNLKDRFLRGVTDVAEADKPGGEVIKSTMDTLNGGPTHIGTLTAGDGGKVLNVPLNHSVVYIIRIK